MGNQYLHIFFQFNSFKTFAPCCIGVIYQYLRVLRGFCKDIWGLWDGVKGGEKKERKRRKGRGKEEKKRSRGWG